MPKVKTKIVELPTYEQLADDEKKKVLDNYRCINTDDSWYEYIINYFVTDTLPSYFKVTEKEVHFSGFWSQGDGACFDGKIEIDDNEIFNSIRDIKEVLSITINKSSCSRHYCHSKTRYIEIVADIEGEYLEHKKVIDTLEIELNKIYQELCNNLYNVLQTEYEYSQTDKAIEETLIANEYTFNRETLRIDS